MTRTSSQDNALLPMHMYKPLPPGAPSRIKAAWWPILARRNVPQGHVPYAEWSRLVDDLCRERNICLARPRDFTPERMRCSIPAEGQWMPVEWLIAYQELFYRDRYRDPAFIIDRATLHLPQARVQGILDSLHRGEVNYPLVVATPRVLAENRKSKIGNRQSLPPTLHRFLVDTLLRQHEIPLWQRSDPDLNTYLEQVRDVTLADLTRTDLLGDDGAPLAFTEDGWLRYLQALYPTLPRPTVTAISVDLGFVAWERDPPAARVIPDAHGLRGGTMTIQERSQLDAVAFRYPLITPSRYLALFAQYHAATGEYLDTNTWSWTLGVIDPKRFPDGPGVNASWDADELNLNRNDPAYAYSHSRLRCSR